MPELAIAKGDGRFGKLLAAYAKTDLLVLDDWAMTELTSESRRDLLEILEDRYGLRSTLVTSQFPVAHWHERIDDSNTTECPTRRSSGVSRHDH